MDCTRVCQEVQGRSPWISVGFLILIFLFCLCLLLQQHAHLSPTGGLATGPDCPILSLPPHTLSSVSLRRRAHDSLGLTSQPGCLLEFLRSFTDDLVPHSYFRSSRLIGLGCPPPISKVIMFIEHLRRRRVSVRYCVFTRSGNPGEFLSWSAVFQVKNRPTEKRGMRSKHLFFSFNRAHRGSEWRGKWQDKS